MFLLCWHSQKKKIYGIKFHYNVDDGDRGIKSPPGPLSMWSLHVLSCQCGLSLGLLDSSHSPKTCTLDELPCLNGPSVSECGCRTVLCDGQGKLGLEPWAVTTGSDYPLPCNENERTGPWVSCFNSSFLNVHIAHILFQC